MGVKLRKFADKLARSIADFMGSWWSVTGFFTLTLGWIFFNTFVYFESYRVDGYPYQFLNLMLGIMAAITGPLVIIGNKSQEKRSQKMIESIYKIEKKQNEFMDHLKKNHDKVFKN